MATGNTKVILMAFGANLGISILKFIGSFLTHSASMLAEAIHSLVDSTNQLLLLLGGRQAKQQPTKEHPLGFGKSSFFWAFMVAIFLFSIGGLFAIYEGTHKLHNNAVVSANFPWINVAILTFGIFLEGGSFIACVKEVNRINRFGSYWSWMKKTMQADLLVIFVEDFAALLGLFIALVCVVLTWLTGSPFYDALGSIIIGSLLVIVSIFLIIEIRKLLIGEAPHKDYQLKIEEFLQDYLSGSEILKLIAIQTGPGEVLLSIKATAGDTLNVKDLVQRTNQLEKRVKQSFPEIRWQFIEFDDKD